eukprot:sb/3461533/
MQFVMSDIWNHPPCLDPSPVIATRLSISQDAARDLISKEVCTCINITTEQGQDMLASAMSHLVDLSRVYRRQAALTTCGVASIAITVDYLDRKSEELSSEEDVFKYFRITSDTGPAILDEGVVRKCGMTLDTLARACTQFYHSATKIRRPETLGDLKMLLEDHFLTPEVCGRRSVILCNYNMALAGQGSWWGGHISPIAAYNSETGHVLVLDVWMYTEPCWVSLEMFLAATRHHDPDSGLPRGFIPTVKVVVKIGTVTEEEKGQGSEHGVDVISFSDLVKDGEEHLVSADPPAPGDIATICYTSGTTGEPKGVMISHYCLISTVYAVGNHLAEHTFTQDDCEISYLPAAHAFERGQQVNSSAVKSYLFNWALGSKKAEVGNGVVRNNSMWDYVIFSKVQKMLGGRVRLMPCGAAPFKFEVLQFFRAALGAVVLEGYGQTESCGCCVVSIPGDYRGGCVGGVVQNCIMKLESVPEMGYHTENNQGEICIKGDNVFSYYFKNPEKTAETLDEGGWLHTGDIGEINAEGGLKIIDRKKNIFKLSQGEYIAPEKIELLYERIPLVSQVCVYGNSTKNNLIALVIPDEIAAKKWAKEEGLEETSMEELVRNKALRKVILDEVGSAPGLRPGAKRRVSYETRCLSYYQICVFCTPRNSSSTSRGVTRRGLPKGAMLTHGSMTSTAYAVESILSEHRMTRDDVNISYLPASHVFERELQYCILMAGGRIGFWQGDVRKLSSDMMELKPTVFACVPRIINRIYDKIMAEVNSSAVKSYLFNWALGSKKAEVGNGVVRNNSMWDYVIFSKVQKMLGGRVRLMPCGAAPFKFEVLQFFRAALGAVVLEGYGQTESCGCCVVSIPGDYRGGCVGGVVQNCVMKLESVPEMGYHTENNQGEICIKGDNVFSYYFKNPEKTAETLDEGGWLHTGDIGEINVEGGLKIIDRKKNIFKLSQGEYIAPEKIELLYERIPLVSQVCVYGNSTKNNLIALVIPDEIAAKKWAKEEGLEETSMEELVRNKALRKVILDEYILFGLPINN